MAMVVFFFVRMNALELHQQTDLNGLVIEAQDISNELMSPGYPPAWTSANVIRVGVVENERVNSSRLDALAELNYTALRKLLRVTNEFFVFIEQGNGCLVPFGGGYGAGNPAVSVPASACVAKTSINLDAADPRTVVPITRFVIYNSTPARLNVYVWNS